MPVSKSPKYRGLTPSAPQLGLDIETQFMKPGDLATSDLDPFTRTALRNFIFSTKSPLIPWPVQGNLSGLSLTVLVLYPKIKTPRFIFTHGPQKSCVSKSFYLIK